LDGHDSAAVIGNDWVASITCSAYLMSLCPSSQMTDGYG